MPKTLADGQLPVSAAALFVGGQDLNYPSIGDCFGTLTLNNTSSSLTQTVLVTFKRQGGTARRLARVVLAPNESGVVSNIPIQAGDTVLGATTTAATVDYVIGASAGGPFDVAVMAASGTDKAALGDTSTDDTPGASTIALGTNSATAAPLPAATSRFYPVTAADDAVGVIIDAADQVTGRVLDIGNMVSNKILKVYAPTGGTINSAAANAAFSSVSGKGVRIRCLSGAGNTWAAM